MRHVLTHPERSVPIAEPHCAQVMPSAALRAARPSVRPACHSIRLSTSSLPRLSAPPRSEGAHEAKTLLLLLLLLLLDLSIIRQDNTC